MSQHEHRNPFLAKTPEERVIQAVERLKFDVQYALQAALKKRGVTKTELAERLGVTPARVSQMFADGANPRVGTVAKAFAVLDEDIFFESETVPFAPRMGEEKRVREIASPAKAFDVVDPENWSRIKKVLRKQGAGVPEAARTDKKSRDVDIQCWKTVTFDSNSKSAPVYGGAANDGGDDAPAMMAA